MTEIVHVTRRADWDAARLAGQIAPPSLATEGFVHCATRAQLGGVLARFYADEPDLVVVVLDTARLGDTVRWEAPVHPDGSPTADDERAERFPHVVGPIPLAAVVGVEAIP